MDEQIRSQWMAAKPRFAPDALARRVVLHGQPVFVVQDPVTGGHWRSSIPLFRVARLLDGRRSVAEAVDAAGIDRAGSKLEDIVKGLSEMVAAGVLRFAGARSAVNPPAALASIRASLQRAVFMTVELGNLQRVLPFAVPPLAWLYTPIGTAIGACLALGAGLSWLGEGPAIRSQFERLSQIGVREVMLGWLMFVAAKIVHELGHAVAAHRAGAAEGLKLSSFRFGVSFMFLLPAPYVDVSPAWLIANRARRAQIGLAGIQVDLLIAALAAFAWSAAGDGFLADRLFELVLLCSASSLLFNANPLVRLDGYYVLSDLLGIPNLQSRSQAALRKLALWPLGLAERIRSASDIAYASYAAASWTWRWSVFIAVFWLAGGLSSTLAYAFAAVIGAIYFAIPLSRGFMGWAALAKRSPRKAVIAPLALAILAAIMLIVPFPVYVVAEGVAWNEGMKWIYAPADGIVVSSAPPGTTSGPIVRLENQELRRTLAQLRVEEETLNIQMRYARSRTQYKADSLSEQHVAVTSQIAAIDQEISTWTIPAPTGATWYPLRAKALGSAWVRRDDQRPLGAAVAGGPLVIRIVLDQWDGPRVLESIAGSGTVSIPLRRRGETRADLAATLVQLPDQARDELPSQALSLAAGGRFAVKADARGIARPIERTFELRLKLTEAPPSPPLLHGERVEALIRLPDATLLSSGWRRLRQSLQQRLGA